MDFTVSRWVARVGLQIVSLFVAVILWLYAVGEQSVEVTLKIPLRVNAPEGRMTVLSSSLRDITVTLSVPRNLLSVVSHQTVAAFHKIQGVEKAGEYNFRIEPKDITLPPGNIRILDIRPEVLTVTLDELIVQKLPVRAALEGKPAEGYIVDEARLYINPNAVLIEGPKSKLEKLDAISTVPVDVVGRTRSFRKRVRLALDPDLRALTPDLAIEVFVPIRLEYGSTVFHDVTVKILGTPNQFEFLAVQPAKVTFAVSGPKAVLDKVTPDLAIVFVDVSGLAQGEYELPLKFKLPNEVVLNQKPPVVRVKIK
jgi:YbbR domain-containing protein